jgi:CRISPR-associated protein Cas1
MTLKSPRHNFDRNISDDIDWAGQSEFWSKRVSTKHPLKKFHFREPLILCGHGVNIRVDQDTLLIRDGLTHYPQTAEQFRFFPGDANLPDRIIVLDGSGGITLDALTWMADQEIQFAQLDWKGQIANFGGNSGYSGNWKLIEAQKEIRGKKVEIAIARGLIGTKIEASLKTLFDVIPKSENRDQSISRLERQLQEIRRSSRPLTISQILGIEGASAAAYFGAWQGLPIKWAGIKRKPIPDNWSEIIPRNMGWRRKTRNARHPLNAMLNYGYGILANNLRSTIIAAGLDPGIGIIHYSTEIHMPLVCDLMEPLRPESDRLVLEFAMSHTFTPGDFTINRLGACRLNPQIAKAIVGITARLDGGCVVENFVGSLRHKSRPVG